MATVKSQDTSVILMGPFLLRSSTTFNVGDFVAFSTSTAGVLDNANAAVAGTNYVAGKLEAIVDSKGGLFLGADGGNLTQITTPASNTTYYGLIIPAFPEYVFEVDANATLGTTTNSDKPGVMFDLANATQVAENSVILPGGTGYPKQVLSLGPAVDASTGSPSTTKVLVRFVKSIWSKT